jgi:hypothetical protein
MLVWRRRWPMPNENWRGRDMHHHHHHHDGFLPYFVARHIANDLDRQGIRPSLPLRVVGALMALTLLVTAATAVFAAGDIFLWYLGII